MPVGAPLAAEPCGGRLTMGGVGRIGEDVGLIGRGDERILETVDQRGDEARKYVAEAIELGDLLPQVIVNLVEKRQTPRPTRRLGWLQPSVGQFDCEVGIRLSGHFCRSGPVEPHVLAP